MKIQDFIISNFNGGLVKHKSDLEMARNEFKNTLNLDFDEVGKAKARRGLQQWGDTKSGILDESFTFLRHTAGSPPSIFHLIVDRASNGTLYQVKGNYSTAAITTASTTISVGNTGAFTASGTAEIDGDLFDYTGVSGGNTLTGVTGLTRSHPAFRAVNQIVSLGSTGIDTRSGCYFSVLNNVLFINGRAGSATFDGTNITAVSDADEPAGLFATNYRERIYVIGSAATDGSGTRNGDPRRVSFSDAGDSTSWDLNNFFDVEDDSGEMGTSLAEINDRLLIFKTNSVFAYDEIQLLQLQWGVGAYNHKVVKKIDKAVYTFCPAGVFVANGSSAKKISEPVDKYLRYFKPDYDATFGRVVLNCFAGVFQKKYLLHIGTIPDPNDPLNSTLTDVVLIYDSIRNNWTVHDTYTPLRHFGSFVNWGYGQTADTAGGSVIQAGETLFAGDGNGKYYRLFENNFYDNQSGRTFRGGNIVGGTISDSTFTPVATILETKLYEVGNPGTLKKFGFLELEVEEGEFNVSYKLDKGDTVTDWIPLGVFTPKDRKKRFKDDKGYRVAFRFTSNSRDSVSTLSMISLRGMETMDLK